MRNKGFTLLELLITILIISILLSAANYTIFNAMDTAKANNAANSIRQLLTEARSLAKTRSEDITTYFSTNKIFILDSSGIKLNEMALEDHVKYNAAGSTITNSKVTFNFVGSPIGTDGTSNSFTNSNNRIAICFYTGESQACTHSKTLNVLPVTGMVEM